MEPWLIGIGVTIVCGLIGVIYYTGQQRDDKQDARFERDEKALADHSREDIQAHERLRALEADMVTVKERLRDVGRGVHEAREAFRIAIADVYKFITDHVLNRLK
jgi:Flp pilus assembly protein TadB